MHEQYIHGDAMTWSSELPTQSGWYWLEHPDWPDDDAEVVRLTMIDGERLIRCVEGELDMKVKWLWSGPLSPPPRGESHGRQDAG